jgi:hypothetical protein
VGVGGGGGGSVSRQPLIIFKFIIGSNHIQIPVEALALKVLSVDFFCSCVHV